MAGKKRRELNRKDAKDSKDAKRGAGVRGLRLEARGWGKLTANPGGIQTETPRGEGADLKTGGMCCFYLSKGRTSLLLTKECHNQLMRFTGFFG